MNTTEQNNKLIAEFMGNNTSEYGNNVYVPKNMMFNSSSQCMQGIFQFSECEFHSDWNWLMEVVEKIESINYKVVIKNNSCSIEMIILNDIFCQSENSKIEAVYKACVELIKWYNRQKY